MGKAFKENVFFFHFFANDAFSKQEGEFQKFVQLFIRWEEIAQTNWILNEKKQKNVSHFSVKIWKIIFNFLNFQRKIFEFLYFLEQMSQKFEKICENSAVKIQNFRTKFDFFFELQRVWVFTHFIIFWLTSS